LKQKINIIIRLSLVDYSFLGTFRNDKRSGDSKKEVSEKSLYLPNGTMYKCQPCIDRWRTIFAIEWWYYILIWMYWIDNNQKIHLTKFFQNFYRHCSLIQLMQIEYIFFSIDSLDVAHQESIRNICPRWNMKRIEKNQKGGRNLWNTL